MAGIERAKESILSAVEQSLEQSGASKDDVEFGCFAAIKNIGAQPK